MPDYPHLLSRLVNAELMLHPEKAETLLAVVLRQAGAPVIVPHGDAAVNAPRLGPVQETMLRRPFEKWGEKAFPFDSETGIAVIEVTGSLAHRQRTIGDSSGITGYDWIGAQHGAAMRDDDVRGILYDIHSAGGEAPGLFALADRIAGDRGRKPMVALADEMAFSAAYMLAAACGQIFLASEFASVGSVGVLWIHFSFERALANEGIAATIVKAGARKDDFNPWEDLPAGLRAEAQARVDRSYAAFVDRVARLRHMDPKAVRATEAGIYTGADAVAVGFADGIAAPADLFRAFADEIAPSR